MTSPLRRMIRRSALCWLVLGPVLVLTLLPFAIMISTALKPHDEVLAFPPHWIPRHVAWGNFVEMWQATDFGTALVNSTVISVCASIVSLAAAIPAAYALSRLPFRGQGAYRQFLLVTQMLSPVLLVLGLFRMAAAIPLGDGSLIDTRSGLIVIYGAFNIAFSVWMLSSYFATIPRELEEAAWIDGAGPLQSLFRIFLPLAIPAIAVTGIVIFVASWNEFVVALTMLRDPARLTVTVRVVNLVAGRYSVEWNQVMAATLVATLPVAVLFAVSQRYLVRGLALGAVK